MWQSEEILLDKVMELYPGPIKLTQTKSVLIALLVGGVVWTVAFLLLAYPGIGNVDPKFLRHEQVIVGLGFAAIGLIVIVLSIRDLRKPRKVVMDAKGFEMTSPSRTNSYTWTQVENFRQVHAQRYTYLVEFDVVDRERPGAPDHVRLPITYGLSTEALLALMQRWREAALTRK